MELKRDTVTASTAQVKDAKTYSQVVTLGGKDANNYQVLAEVQILVKPYAITVTPNSNLTKVYRSGDDPIIGHNPPTLLASDEYSGNLSRVAGENAGNYPVLIGDLKAGGNNGDNYAITVAEVNFVITPKTLTVTQGGAIIYNSASQDVPLSVVGVESGDSVTASTAQVKDAGSYSLDVNLSGDHANNYQVTEKVAVTVTPKTLTVTKGGAIIYNSASQDLPLNVIGV
jgi:hypothetical protein